MAEEETDEGPDRVSKRELIRLVARRSGETIAVTERVYEAMLAEVAALSRSGTQVNLSGYGRFYTIWHKGHQAQFGAAGEGPLPDYLVLKFSASRRLSDFLAMDAGKAAGTRVPGTTLVLDQGDDRGVG